MAIDPLVRPAIPPGLTSGRRLFDRDSADRKRWPIRSAAYGLPAGVVSGGVVTTVAPGGNWNSDDGGDAE